MAGILIVASVLLLSAPTSLLLTETVPWTYYVAATAALGGVGLLLPVVHRQVARR